MITYNHEQYIAEAIEGVLMQEVDFEVELIIADDASTDRTGEVIQSYIDSHPRGYWIKYTSQPVNKGMMDNFIWALEQCKGEYVALCEGDDFWTDSRKIEKQVDVLKKNPNISLSFHDAYFLYEDLSKRKFSEKYIFLNSKVVFELQDLMDYQWFVPTASIVFRNYTFPDWYKGVSAGDFTLQLILAQEGNFHYINTAMSVYRIHSNGQSNALRRYDLRMKDIKLWFLHLSKVNKFRLFRWYSANYWRYICFKLFSN